MCLSTVYMNSENEQKEIMKDCGSENQNVLRFLQDLDQTIEKAYQQKK